MKVLLNVLDKSWWHLVFLLGTKRQYSISSTVFLAILQNAFSCIFVIHLAKKSYCVLQILFETFTGTNLANTTRQPQCQSQSISRRNYYYLRAFFHLKLFSKNQQNLSSISLEVLGLWHYILGPVLSYKENMSRKMSRVQFVPGNCTKRPFAGPGHMTYLYPPLNLRIGTLWVPETKRAGKISRTAKFEVCSIQI